MGRSVVGVFDDNDHTGQETFSDEVSMLTHCYRGKMAMVVDLHKESQCQGFWSTVSPVALEL